MKKEEKLYTEKQLGEKWREGYESGIKIALQQNATAVKIGNAILDALDDRYKFADEID